MQTAFNVIQIIVSVSLALVILLQVKGGGLGGIFGQADSVYRTKRGLEKRLFQMTVGLAVVFVIVSIISLKVA
ncbi:MAG TPA: preprotein translocase subunit SecG [Dehalococcoidales bacterium]|nr:preprotein translocase subunit SecG [Dehalococcoidales bacterium]